MSNGQLIDIKDFYLYTRMNCYEYMRLKITDIPDEIVKEYKLDQKVTTDGYIYTEIQKGMYGLPQAGIIALFQASGNMQRNRYALPLWSTITQSSTQGNRMQNI